MVNPDVGVVRPGVGVVRTDVEASGEDDVQRWEPVSLSNGEDLKYPPFSALVEDLKWPPSMAVDRKLPPSVKKRTQQSKLNTTQRNTCYNTALLNSLLAKLNEG